MTRRANLLPVTYRRRKSIERSVSGWLLTLTACVMAFALDAVWQYRQQQALLDPIIALRAEAEPLQEMGGRESELKRRKAALDQRWSTIAYHLGEDDMLQTLGAVAQEVTKLGSGTADLESLSVVLGGADSKQTHLEMRARVPDDATAALLVGALRKHPRLQEVNLRSSTNGRNEGSRLIEVSAIPRVMPVEDAP